jgi:hypothetical protein
MLRKVRPGERFRPEAATWNTFIDLANAQAGRDRSIPALPGGFNNQALILVRNDSGADRARFDVLGLSDPVISPDDNEAEFKNRVCLKGVEPDSSEHYEHFCILQEPIADGAIGVGLVWGLTPCRIDVQDEADAFAAVTSGVYETLYGGTAGCRIVWKPADTGEQWALVLVGDVARSLRVKLLTTLSSEGSASAAILEPAPSRDETAADAITVVDGLLAGGDSVGADTIMIAHRVGNVWTNGPWACP